jgi:hypothetical protein
MTIDCESCPVRGLACNDCVVSLLLGSTMGDMDQAELEAVEAMAEAGLVPTVQHPLRAEAERFTGLRIVS